MANICDVSTKFQQGSTSEAIHLKMMIFNWANCARLFYKDSNNITSNLAYRSWVILSQIQIILYRFEDDDTGSTLKMTLTISKKKKKTEKRTMNYSSDCVVKEPSKGTKCKVATLPCTCRSWDLKFGHRSKSKWLEYGTDFVTTSRLSIIIGLSRASR